MKVTTASLETATAPALRNAIKRLPVGEPFVSSRFLSLGTRSAVDQALSRLAREGEVMRVARGVYVRPQASRLFGKTLPSTEAIVRAVATAHGETIEMHGAEAERRFGLTTQTMMKPVFLTTGPTRKLKIGKIEVELRHVAPRKLAMAGTKAGQALLALINRGQKHVGEREIEQIRRQLSTEEFERLATAFGVAPGWLVSALSKHREACRGA